MPSDEVYCVAYTTNKMRLTMTMTVSEVELAGEGSATDGATRSRDNFSHVQ